HELAKRATTVGTVFVFGNGDCGQLGLGDDMIERKKPFPVGALKDEKIVDIVSGGLHTMALTDNGRLWSWGCNDQKALGRGGDEYTAAPVEGLDSVKITKVACSDSATFALSEDGHVYSWGTFRSAEGIMGFTEGIEIQDMPMVVNAFREPIVDLCSGVDHAIALSASGKVYAWGYGQQGQLGRLIMERRRTRGLTPEKLRLQDIHHIGSGSYHSFAVAKDGTVYAWGLNNFHQLGLRPEDGGNEEIVHEPTVVAALNGLGVVKISGGEHHSIALTKDGKLYSFGRSDSHQTGLPFDTLATDKESQAANGNESSHKKAITAPTLVDGAPKLADFVCGSNHNIALADSGKAYTWGYGEMLQLGNGEEEDIEQPTLLEGQKIDGKKIAKIAAGGQHSVVLAN
ncbi:RCC1/BLIP-II, partial [Martensiomyces pterosporus]